MRIQNVEAENFDQATLDSLLGPGDLVKQGLVNTKDEFVIMKLSDTRARAALSGYLMALMMDEDYDCEYAEDLTRLSHRASHNIWFNPVEMGDEQ